jgi:hypothetical protein
MIWLVLAIALTLWIVEFGFSLGGWIVPVLNSGVLLFYLIQLKKDSRQI